MQLLSEALLLALQLLAIPAGGGVTGGGLAPLPDFSFGGRTRHGGLTYVLDAGSLGPRIVGIGASGLSSSLKLVVGQWALQPDGLARSPEGVFWALADKGRALVGFDATLGTVAAVKPLTDRCLGVWDIGGIVIVAPLRMGASERAFLRETGAVFSPFSSLSTRRGSDPVEQSVLNLLKCGGGRAAELPCWWIAGEPEVLVFGETGDFSKLPGRSMARLSEKASPVPKAPKGLTYPIRDVFLLDGGSYWVLLNQEGEKAPFEEGAVRGKHVIRVSRSSPDVILAVAGEGRIIVDADETGVLILTSDGLFVRVKAQ